MVQQGSGRVLRSSGGCAIWNSSLHGESAYRAGLEVLVDTLLLSRCTFLLKSASAVSEFAIYFNPRLALQSFDFNIKDQPLPSWARQDRVGVVGRA